MFGITSDMLYRFAIRAFVLLTAMPVHEFAHGFVADRLGDDTPYHQGRLTLNPMAHLDLFGSLLLFFTGFGWAKPVEVDMRKFQNPRRDMAIVSLAGPCSNLLIALLVLIFYKLVFGFSAPVYTGSNAAHIIDILGQIVLINLGLAVFNFLPVPPLDGSKIFGAILPNKLYYSMLRYQRQISIAFILLMFTGLLSLPLNFLAYKGLQLLNFLTKPVELLFR